jgi:hypothetical protein
VFSWQVFYQLSHISSSEFFVFRDGVSLCVQASTELMGLRDPPALVPFLLIQLSV